MKQKRISRQQRWDSACASSHAALDQLQLAWQELIDIQDEFEEWRDNLPENLQQSAVGEKLESVCDLDLDNALDEVIERLEEAESADLPLGFGKD